MPRPKATRKKAGDRTAVRDSLDFRDWIYEPALVPLPESQLPDRSLMEILDQGEEGACTGFGLAAVINYLLRHRDGAGTESVSPRMLYEMAKKHDQWPGADYEGSSARGAMKGWYKHGVCPASVWPDDLGDPGAIDDDKQEAALRYPLGAFYRILPRRSDLHAALRESGAVFATAATHRGWDETEEGIIPFNRRWKEQGGHAFAIVGYTHEGFLIQNSWDVDWGGVAFTGGDTFPGCAIWTYEDFDRNVWDAWVARLARPVESVDALTQRERHRASYTRGGPPARKGPPRLAIRDHYVHLDDGRFEERGDYFSTPRSVEGALGRAVRSNARHLVFYAHGGNNRVRSSAVRAGQWRPVLDAQRIHEVHFIWETGIVEELKDVLLGKRDFAERRAGGSSDWFDRWIERSTGPLGRSLWGEMQEDAALAFVVGDRPADDGHGTTTLRYLLAALAAEPTSRRPVLHLAGHSAGSILLGHLLTCWRKLTAGLDDPPTFENVVLFAPACTHEFFDVHHRAALAGGTVRTLHHMHLDKASELDDSVAGIYRKSILYLVSRAYQRKGHVVPIMGLEEHLDDLPVHGVAARRIRHYSPITSPTVTAAARHEGFDGDVVTMNSLLRLILDAEPSGRVFEEQDLRGY